MKAINFILFAFNLFVTVALFMVSWNWFVADTFSIMSLGFAEAFGVYFVTRFFKNHEIKLEHDDEEKEFAKNSIQAVALLAMFIVAILIKFSIGI